MKLFLSIAISLCAALPARADDHSVPTPSAAPTCEASDSSCLVLEEDQSFDLAEGGSLAFLGIPEDSRCPLDALCIWQGRVRVALKHQGLDESQKFELGLGGTLKPQWIDASTGLVLSLEQVWPDKLLSAPSDEPYRIKLRIEADPEVIQEEQGPAQHEQNAAQQTIDRL